MIDGSPMVFPLGPALNLSWATCTIRTDPKKRRPPSTAANPSPDIGSDPQ
jgi:hypothetical protein